jgi:hypothetical protein
MPQSKFKLNGSQIIRFDPPNYQAMSYKDIFPPDFKGGIFSSYVRIFITHLEDVFLYCPGILKNDIQYIIMFFILLMDKI